MKIKNLIIVNDFNYVQGGASKVAIDTANILKEDIEKIYFFSAVNNYDENIEKINYISTNQNEALKEKSKLKGFINGIYNLKAKNEFKKLLLTLKREETIIHVHGWTKALSCSVIDIALKLQFKVVFTLHDYFSICPNGGFFNYKKNQICKLNALSLKCIMCNCDSRNYCFKIYRLIRQFVQNKVVKLPKKMEYAIGISDLSMNVLKKDLNSNIYIQKICNPIRFEQVKNKNDYTKNDYFLYVGRIVKEKGVEIFCRVLTELNLKGIVVGDGTERERLERLYSNIVFTGWKSENEVKEYMAKAKCLIFPSLWYEGAPLTPLESFSLGIPCLINSDCSAREYGKEFVYSNYDELKKKIIKINTDIEPKFNFDILKEYSIDNYKKKLLNLYELINNESRE